jgi:hypothetical protein
MLLKLTYLLVALASVVETRARKEIQSQKLAKASKQSKSAAKGGKDPDPEDSTDAPTPAVGNAYDYKFGGWVGDNDWGVQIPFANLDFLNYGYLTCLNTLQNGPCSSPGMRSASSGPPAGTNGAKCVKFVLGGQGCEPSASGWDVNKVASAATQYGWCGVDVENVTCPRAKLMINLGPQTMLVLQACIPLRYRRT